MINHGISAGSAPIRNEQKEQPAAVKQNGTAHHNSLFHPANLINFTHSDTKPQEQAYSMIVVKPKSKKTFSPRELEAAEERVSSSDEVEARMSVDWSVQEDLF